MASLEFSKHQRPNASRLEAHREEIIAMRHQEWPYTRIAVWLFEEKSLRVSAEAVRKFCELRQIRKGGGGGGASRRMPAQKKPQSSGSGKRPFEYDDSLPIQTRKNQ